tara:strand:- start:690 stop:830 length:141 start_codon:yes stop_codon:yes gene_type:complete
MKYFAIAVINTLLFAGMFSLNLTDNLTAIAIGMASSMLISTKLLFW